MLPPAALPLHGRARPAPCRAAGLLFLLALAGGAAAQERPNVVLIYVDDLRLDDLAHMPAIQEHLRTRGLSFERYLATTPLCTPSRASLLRGQYAHNTGVLTNWTDIEGGWEEWRGRELAASTLATWLQAAGYRTAIAGKFLNQYPSATDQAHVDPGWDSWLVAHSKHRGSDGLYFGYEVTDDGAVAGYGDAPEDHSNDVFGRRIYAFIRDALADGVPFFAYYAPFAPHADPNVTIGGEEFLGHPVPAPRHAGAFAGRRAPRAPSFNELDLDDKPAAMRALPPLDAFADARLDTLYRARLEATLSVDEWVGRYVAALDSAGALDRTYLFFASDNGFMYGEHRLRPEDKGGPYEESVRLPLLVRGPGVAAGATVGAPTLNVDLAPTIAELAGAEAPSFVDGRSLVPFLRGQTPPAWRNVAYVEHWKKQGGTTVRDYDVVHADSLKLIRTGDWVELYRLRRDPFELEGLPFASDQRLLDSLRATADRVAACAGAACRAADQAAFLRPPPDDPDPPEEPEPGPPGLSPPFPNPASGTARLRLTVARTQWVEVAAYDALGRRAALLFAGEVEPEHPRGLVLSTAHVAAGLYVVRAVGADFAYTQRVTLLR